MPDINLSHILSAYSDGVNKDGVKIRISPEIRQAAQKDQARIENAEKNSAALRNEYKKQSRELHEMGGRYTGRIGAARRERDKSMPFSAESKRANEQLRHLKTQKKDLKDNVHRTKSGVEEIHGRDGYLTLETKAQEARTRETELEAAVTAQLDQIDQVSAMARTIKQKLQADLKQLQDDKSKFYEKIPQKNADGSAKLYNDGKTPVTETVLKEPFDSYNKEFERLLSQTEFEVTIPPSINIGDVGNQFVELFNRLEAQERYGKADKETIDAHAEDINSARKEAYTSSKDAIIKENAEHTRGGAENFTTLDAALQEYNKNPKDYGKDENYNENSKESGDDERS